MLDAWAWYQAYTCDRTSTSEGDQLVAPFPIRRGTLGVIRLVASVVGSSVQSSTYWSEVSWLPSRFDTKKRRLTSGSHTGPWARMQHTHSAVVCTGYLRPAFCVVLRGRAPPHARTDSPSGQGASQSAGAQSARQMLRHAPQRGSRPAECLMGTTAAVCHASPALCP